MILEFEDIQFTYTGQTQPALDGITVRFESGEKVALVGHNGSGKSSLILHANGILRPQKGEVRLDGQIVRYDKRSLQVLRRNVGLVFQNPEEQLFSASDFQDISLGPLNLKMSYADTRQRVMEIAEECGILHLLDRPTHALSGGEKTRAALAGVLAMKPKFIFADELTNSLDPWMRYQMIEILDHLVEEGCAVILASHDLQLVRDWAQRVIWIEHGRVYRQGSPEIISGVMNNK